MNEFSNTQDSAGLLKDQYTVQTPAAEALRRKRLKSAKAKGLELSEEELKDAE